MVDINFLEYQEIADSSLVFLHQFDEANSMPIPVEDIVEIKLKLDIVPLPGLLKYFDVDGLVVG